jgi:Na+-translocating ferredoxin:NAD+ oxidoreductase subunit C
MRQMRNCLSDGTGTLPAYVGTVYKKWDLVENEQIIDCMECGSCSYICPSGRPLLDYIRLGKSTVSKIIRSRKQ